MRFPIFGSLPALALAIASSGLPTGASAQSQPGRLVVIGGGLARDNLAVYRSILDARDGSGPLCVIPTAAADPTAAIPGAVANFDRHGGSGTAAGVLIDVARPETAHDPAVVRALLGCSGFYFSGGVQSRILQALLPGEERTPALAALLRRHAEGAVVSGSSAGAAIMSDPMIAGGSSAGAVRNGIRRAGAGEADDSAESAGGVSIARGLGLLPGALVDQHFLARGRVGRLIVALDQLPEFDLGFGIDENTALVVAGDAAWTVGASGVVVLDARASGSSGSMRLHLMSRGDRFDMARRRLTMAADKAPLPTAGEPVALPDDVFARWSFLHLLADFGRSTAQVLEVPTGTATLVLRKTAGFQAQSLPGTGVQGTPDALSITGLELELRRRP